MRSREEDYIAFIRDFDALCDKYAVQIVQAFPDTYALENRYDDEAFYLGDILTPAQVSDQHYRAACSAVRDWIYNGVGSWLFNDRRSGASREKLVERCLKSLENNHHWRLINDTDKVAELYDEAVALWDEHHHSNGHLRNDTDGNAEREANHD